jgi:hypothetical protein
MGLWEDLHVDDVLASVAAGRRNEADAGLRMRDLVSTGQVTQHTLSDDVRSFEDESQDGGDAEYLRSINMGAGSWLASQPRRFSVGKALR